jgi:uncharacterized membrane protein YdjX (TVP38/TMEM64 family)
LIVTLIRVPPSSPFAVTNTVMAATRVPVIPFVLGTVIGIAPRTAAVVYTARRAEQLKDLTDINDMTSFLAGLATTAALILLLIYLARRALKHVTRDA